MYPALHRHSVESLLPIYREVMGWTLGYVIAGNDADLAPDDRAISPLLDDAVDSSVLGREPAIACNCACFDAITMPALIGQAMLTACEGGPQIPAFVSTHPSVVPVLIEPGTGSACASAVEHVLLHTGSRSWITVPPSPGNHWDIPPWTYSSHQRAPLPNGENLIAVLHRVLRVLNLSGVYDLTPNYTPAPYSHRSRAASAPIVPFRDSTPHHDC